MKQNLAAMTVVGKVWGRQPGIEQAEILSEDGYRLRGVLMQASDGEAEAGQKSAGGIPEKAQKSADPHRWVVLLHGYTGSKEMMYGYAYIQPQLVTGVTVVRNDFLAEHPEAVAEFIAQQDASVTEANADAAAYAQYVVDLGIIEAAPVATKAIPNCHLVCITGADMQQTLAGYLQTLFDADPTSVGGAVPADDFYYLG